MGKNQIYYITISNWEKYNGNLKKGHKAILVSTGFLSDAKIRSLSPVTKLLYLSCLLVAGELTQSQIEVSHDSLVYQSGVKSGSIQSQLDQLQSLQLLTYSKSAPNIIEKKRKEEKGIEKKEVGPPPQISDPFFRKNFDPKQLPKAGELWNSNCSPLTKIVSTTRTWNTQGDQILRDHGEEEFVRAIGLLTSNTFLSGKNNRKWKATFSWFINPDNFGKVLNGDYTSEHGVESMLEQLKKDLEAS